MRPSVGEAALIRSSWKNFGAVKSRFSLQLRDIRARNPKRFSSNSNPGWYSVTLQEKENMDSPGDVQRRYSHQIQLLPTILTFRYCLAIHDAMHIAVSHEHMSIHFSDSMNIFSPGWPKQERDLPSS